MRKRKFAALRTILALLLACLFVVPAITAKADTTTNQAVMDDTGGVIQIKVIYTDDDRNESIIQTGTGFLINDETLVTCNHVVSLSPEVLAAACMHFGKTEKEIKDRLSIQISVLRDVAIRATVQTSSEEVDFAVLRMETRINNRKYLKIRPSNEVKQTETVYALGFPGEVTDYQDLNTFTGEDVTITSGQVNKLTTISTVDYIQHSARLTSGNSGGPLVDADGNVIGINQGSTSGNGFDVDYFYGIAIDQLTEALDALGIDYTKADGNGTAVKPDDNNGGTTVPPTSEITSEQQGGGTVVVPTTDKSALSTAVNSAKGVVATNYKQDEKWNAFQSALSEADSVLSKSDATQTEIDAAKQKLADAQFALTPASNFKLPVWLIAVIVGIILVIVIIVVLIIVLVNVGKKKKAPTTTNAYPPAPSYTPMANNSPAQGFNSAPAMPSTNFATMPSKVGAGETSVLNAGAGETTVLNAGAGETTVLNSNVNYGTLTRVKTGEKIKINSDNFVIGKELSRVNYCVSDNTSISRTHVRFTNKGGITYVTDLKTTNGTFLNSVKLQPGQETALKPGDKLSLSDEEFTYSN